MLHIANPIYDIIFKYLMEDNRAAKTILSALLKKEVLQEKDVRLKEQTDMLRTSVKILLEAGMSKEVIAVSLDRTLEEIEAIAKD